MPGRDALPIVLPLELTVDDEGWRELHRALQDFRDEVERQQPREGELASLVIFQARTGER